MSETAPKDGETGEENPEPGETAETTAPPIEQEDGKTDAPEDPGETIVDAPKEATEDVKTDAAEDPGETAVDAPKETTEAVPETSEVVPETSEVVAETSEAVPETSEAVPDTSEAVPEASEEVVAETSEAVPDTSEAVPEASEEVPGTEDALDTTEKVEVEPATTEEVGPEATEDVVPETTEEAPVNPEETALISANGDEVEAVPATTEEVGPETTEDVVLETTEEAQVNPEEPVLSSATGDEELSTVPVEPTTETVEQTSATQEEGESPLENEEMPADLTLPLASEEGLAEPDVRKVEVPEKHVDISPRPSTAERLANEKMQAHADRLRDAVASAMAGIGDDLSDDSDMASALSAWKAKLDSHVQELQGIVQQKASPTVDPASSLQLASPFAMVEATPEEQADEILGNVANVRSMRHQLESHRTGRDVEEVTNAWGDPEDAEKEVEDLRRVRRQIRYLFGGMIGNLPDSSNLKIDDLISDHGDTEPYMASVPVAPPMRPPGIPQSPRHMGGPFAAAVAAMPEASRIKGVSTAAMESPRLPPSMGQQARPRSGGTESLESVTNSSVATWNGAEEEERRRERKERKHRSRGREHRSVEPPRETQKKDDGAMPPKQWNWAEEVVKASLDPGNQWEFPGANDARNVDATPPRVPRRGQPSWEQPRQVPPRVPGGGPRGQDIAVKTRERAEEVLRSERERRRNFFEPDVVEAAYR